VSKNIKDNYPMYQQRSCHTCFSMASGRSQNHQIPAKLLLEGFGNCSKVLGRKKRRI
jgi:hypothetical protein